MHCWCGDRRRGWWKSPSLGPGEEGAAQKHLQVTVIGSQSGNLAPLLLRSTSTETGKQAGFVFCHLLDAITWN